LCGGGGAATNIAHVRRVEVEISRRAAPVRMEYAGVLLLLLPATVPA